VDVIPFDFRGICTKAGLEQVAQIGGS
jgi:hypothetical protein